MIGYLVIGETRNCSPIYQVTVDEKDALILAENMVNKLTGFPSSADPAADRCLYEDLLYHFDQEDGVRVSVEPVGVLEKLSR